jgi:plasmid stability protein
LNIDDLPDAHFRKLRTRARRRGRSISQEAKRILEQALEERERLPLLELEGLGKVHLSGIEPANYVDVERRSWE